MSIGPSATAVALAVLACAVLQVLAGVLIIALCRLRRPAKFQVAPCGLPPGELAPPGRFAAPRPPADGLAPWNPDGQPDPYRR